MYTRICNLCNRNITYKNVVNYNTAIKNNSICRSCAAKKRIEMYGSTITKLNEDVRNGRRKNGFFGKSHSVETIQKLKETDKSYTKTPEFRKKISNVTQGESNPMYGKNFYMIWVEKYGKDIADEKLQTYKKNMSKKNVGESNPMYGKPAPVGSGNGWSGWYKNWYFRSLLELSYMINVIERFNIEWESAEKKSLTVEYTNCLGNKRTYQADFLLNKKYLVEIKPKRLRNTADNLLKKEAANNFCLKNNLIYKVTSCQALTNDELKNLIETKKIILTKRYYEKYKDTFSS